MTRRPVFAALAAFVLAFAVPAAARQPAVPAPGPDPAIAAADRDIVIERALAALDKSYVFPEVAAKMAQAVQEKRKAGGYDAIAGSRQLARTLTEDLQAVSKDKHLRVTFGSPPGAGAAGGSAHARMMPRFENEGFERVEKLAGNIGYVEVRTFLGRESWEEKAAEAMTQLADADALIVDLRRNGGGSPELVAVLSSYLFDQPTHLNSLYWREGNRTDDFWTSKDVKGKRYGQSKPVYVLTSKRTFSGAEEFAYNLKNLRRATLVGETTGGGAHPGGMRRLHGDFRLFVPTGRAISPITKTNWEGVGVAPDVATAADEALEAAKALALKALGKG
jgi:hypothetical protein